MSIHTQRVLAGLIAILGAFLVLPATTFAASHAAPTRSQCNGASIPPGWIIINHTTNATQCGGSPSPFLLLNSFIVGNMETIAPPPPTHGTSIACEDSPLPAGFVIIAQVPLARCETGNLVQKTGGINEIASLAPRVLLVRVCASSPIPPGWVIVDTHPVPPPSTQISNSTRDPNSTPESCQIDLQQVLLDRQQGAPPSQPSFQIEHVTGRPMTICSFSPTPAGYSRQALITNADCGPNPFNAALILPHTSPQGEK